MSTMTKSKNHTPPDVDEEALAAALADEAERTGPPAEVLAAVAARKAAGPGRPSLSGGAEKSPQVGARVPFELRDKLQARADSEGKTLSEIVRDAFEAYTS